MGADLSTCQNGHVCECCLARSTKLRAGACHMTNRATLSALVERFPLEFEWIANKLRLNGVVFSDSPPWHQRSSTTTFEAPTTVSMMQLGNTQTGMSSKRMAADQAGLGFADSWSDAATYDTSLSLEEAVFGWPAENLCGAAAAIGTEPSGVQLNSRLPLDIFEVSCKRDSEIHSRNADEFMAALCDDGDLYELGEALLGEFFSGIEAEDKWQQASGSRHDSGVSSSVASGYQLMTPVDRPHLPSTYESTVSPFGSQDPAASPNGTANSVAALTDEPEEEFLADIDQLIYGERSTAAEESVANADEESECSEWLLKSDDASSHGVAPLVPGSSLLSPNAQASTGPRRRGRKRCVSPSTRRERKRQQNREAAQRYRNRKHGEVNEIDSTLDEHEQKNRELRDELRRAETERNILLRFADHFDLRGLMREQLGNSRGTDSESNSKRMAASLASLEKLTGQNKRDAAVARSPFKQTAARLPTEKCKIVTIVRPSPIPNAAVTDATRKRREPFASPVASKLARR